MFSITLFSLLASFTADKVQFNAPCYPPGSQGPIGDASFYYFRKITDEADYKRKAIQECSKRYSAQCGGGKCTLSPAPAKPVPSRVPPPPTQGVKPPGKPVGPSLVQFLLTCYAPGRDKAAGTTKLFFRKFDGKNEAAWNAEYAKAATIKCSQDFPILCKKNNLCSHKRPPPQRVVAPKPAPSFKYYCWDKTMKLLNAIDSPLSNGKQACTGKFPKICDNQSCTASTSVYTFDCSNKTKKVGPAQAPTAGQGKQGCAAKYPKLCISQSCTATKSK